MENQIIHPSVPYIGPIYGGCFIPGNIIRIQGTLQEAAHRFHVNLHCGSNLIYDDVAMQVLLRLRDEYISLNSYRGGIWGEEHGAPLSMKQTKQFEIILMCESKQYKIVINGQYYCEFPQIISYNRITHLLIDGDITINCISYESALDDLIGITSENGDHGFSENDSPSVSECETDDFNTMEAKPPAIGWNPPKGIFRRRSYEAAIYGKQMISTSPSPDIDFQRVHAFYSTSSPHHSTSSPRTISPVNGLSRVADPIIEESIHLCPYPTSSDTEMLTPPVGASSNNLVNTAEEIKTPNWSYFCSTCCGLAIGLIFLLGIILLYVEKE